jgi:broad specificity phosphatase PhoE
MMIFALRHADRVSENVDALSDAGKVRAKLLGRMLAQSGIQNAYCSDARRTQDTIAPLKALPGVQLTVHEVPVVGNDVNGHVQAIVTALKALPADSTAAVIGHTNTIDGIIKALTNEVIAEIKPNEFDKLFVLSIPAGSPSLTLLRYGAPTP